MLLESCVLGVSVNSYHFLVMSQIYDELILAKTLQSNQTMRGVLWLPTLPFDSYQGGMKMPSAI